MSQWFQTTVISAPMGPLSRDKRASVSNHVINVPMTPNHVINVPMAPNHVINVPMAPNHVINASMAPNHNNKR